MIGRARVGVRRGRAVALVALGVWAGAGVGPGAVPARGQAANPAETRLRFDVDFLADDDREGRAPGTSGIEASASYIAGVFKEAGLRPAPGLDNYFQPFTISGNPKLGKESGLAFFGPDGKSVLAEDRDLAPLAIGSGGDWLDAPVVFAGYGITTAAGKAKLDYDDYGGVDPKGKIVLVLRREPKQGQDDSPFDGKPQSTYATFRHKVTNAFRHGASAVLLVNDLDGLKGESDRLIGLASAGTEANSNLPVVMITRAFADKLLAGAGKSSLESLEKEINADLKPHSFEVAGWSSRGKSDVTRTPVATRNVVGVLEGSGPSSSETVVVGAHYDHLGRGGAFSGSLMASSQDIHNGADDNASGTAMVLEMVRRLSRRPDLLPRRVVFIAFSGEERGLLGSRHYVEHPPVPLKDTVAMVNFDMVGRLNGSRELTMIGTGTSPGEEDVVKALGASAGLKIKTVAGMTDGFGGSDHQSFYEKGIPVLFGFTGVHADYHRPTDDTARINFAGMARIADYAELLLLDLLRRPERPAFAKLAEPAGHGSGGGDPARVSISAYLGTMPDYADSDKGVKLAGVRDGSPADKGGLKGGDRIVKFGGKPVGTIYDYMEGLASYKPGDEVEVVVVRDGKETPVKVTLGRKPGD